MQRPGLDPWVGKIPWRKEWQPTPVFLPGESHGQKILAGCSTGSQRVRHNWVTNTFILPSFPLSNTIRYSFVWFLSVSIIILRFVFATSLINISFFPLAEKYSIVGVIRNSLTPCWVTFWFPILGYCKKPMSIFFYMSLYGYTLPFVRLMPPSRMLGVECLHVWLLKNTQTVFQRGTILHC